MHIIHCTTVDQLKVLIKKALFRPHTETLGDVDEAELTPEGVCEMLGIDPDALLEERTGKEDPDLYGDNLSMMEVETHVLICDGIPMLRDFKPGVLVFHIEDAFDRMGSTEHHTFHYVSNEDMTFDKWVEWYHAIQKDYAANNAIRDHQSNLKWD
jgi:hypothetical protein